MKPPKRVLLAVSHSASRNAILLNIRGFLLAAAALATSCAAPVLEPDNVVDQSDSLECSSTILSTLGPLDIAIVIDTSRSTREPTGRDIDGDGAVGVLRNGVSSDLDDSRLGAQVAAVRPLLKNAQGYDVQFSIVTFSGPVLPPTGPTSRRVVREREAQIRAELSDDLAKLNAVLDGILERGSQGTTDFHAGMRRANRSLLEAPDLERMSRKLVLFMSDAPGPTQHDLAGKVRHFDPRMELAARQALRHAITFNTFGVSNESDTWRMRPIGRIAGATGGTYHIVEDPSNLYCHLVSSIATAASEAQ